MRAAWDDGMDNDLILLIGIVAGFAGGYGVREMISQHRRAAVEAALLQDRDEEHFDARRRQIKGDPVRSIWDYPGRFG